MPPKTNQRCNQPCQTSTSNLRNQPSPPPPPPVQPPPIETYEINFGGNQEYMTNFLRQHNRPLVPSRFHDPQATQSLGVDREVRRLFQNIGWEYLLEKHADTYSNITYKFFSTFKLTRQANFFSPKSISFNCLGDRITLTASQINRILGFPRHRELTRPHTRLPSYQNSVFLEGPHRSPQLRP